MISERLRQALKLSPIPMYKVAHKAGLHPSMVSKLLHGIEQVKPGDKRVLRLGKVLRIPPSELFEKEASKEK